MAVYRMNDNSGAVFSYSLEEENIPSIETCFIDASSSGALNRLIEGPILGIQDLIGAEIYLRALFFHETIRPIGPSIQVHQHSINQRNPFVYTTWSSSSSRNHALDEIHKNVHHNSYICPIDWVITFDSPEAEKIVAKQNEFYQRHCSELNNQVSSVIDSRFFYFEKICESIDDYERSVFDKSDELISKFLIEIPKARIPTYFSKNKYCDILSLQMNDRLKYFLSPIERDWEKHCNDIVHHCLSFRCPPFLAIILHNAKCRENIVNEILDFREKFKNSRKELWDIIDDVAIRNNGDLKKAHKFLKKIETDAEKIIPTALNNKNTGISFNFCNAAFSFVSIIYNICQKNIISPSDANTVLQYIYSKFKKNFSLQSSKVVYKNLDSLLNNWYSLEKHFTEAELENLRKPIAY